MKQEWVRAAQAWQRPHHNCWSTTNIHDPRYQSLDVDASESHLRLRQCQQWSDNTHKQWKDASWMPRCSATSLWNASQSFQSHNISSPHHNSVRSKVWCRPRVLCGQELNTVVAIAGLVHSSDNKKYFCGLPHYAWRFVLETFINLMSH